MTSSPSCGDKWERKYDSNLGRSTNPSSACSIMLLFSKISIGSALPLLLPHLQQEFAFESIQLRLPPALCTILDTDQRFIEHLKSFVHLSLASVSLGKQQQI